MRVPVLVATAVLFLDELLFNVIVPLVPRYAERFDLSTSEVGLLLAAYPLLMLLTGVPGGLLVARAGPRPVLVGGAVLLAAASAATGLADAAWQLWLARAALGLVSGVTLTAAVVAVVEVTPTVARGRALATTFAVAGIGAIIGPGVGGVVMPAIGLDAGHLVLAGFALAVAGMGAACAWPSTGRIDEPHTRERLGELLSSPGALRGGAAILVSGLAVGAAQTLAPLHLEAAGVGEASIGLVFVAGMAFGVIGARVVGGLADRYGAALLASVAGGIVVAAVVGLALGPRAVGVAALALIVAAGGFWLGTLAYLIGSDAGAERDAGSMAPLFGLTLTAWGAGGLAGPPLAGAIADAATPGLAYATVAVICSLLLVPLVAASRRRVEHLGTTS